MEYRAAEWCIIALIILFRFLLFCSIYMCEDQQVLARVQQWKIRVGRQKILVKDCGENWNSNIKGGPRPFKLTRNHNSSTLRDINIVNSYLSRPGIDSIEGDFSLTESLLFFTTPISLLPFHVVFKIGLDRGYFYQFVCFLRLFSLYQKGRILMNWEQRNITLDGTG